MLLSSAPRNSTILLLSVPLITLAFWAEWQDYFSLWYHSIIYTHGFLVLGCILFLLFRERASLGQLAPTGSRLGLIALLGLVAAMLFAKAADIKTIRLVLLPLIIVAWGWTIWGPAFLRRAGPKILLLLFAAPIWDDFSFVLQTITVAVDEHLLSLFNVPATIDEFYITIPSGVFHVAGGCSGVRYLMVGLFFGCFQAMLSHSNLWRSLLLVAVGGFLSMLANWVRVFGIIYAGHLTEMESSLVKDHEAFGWVVFVVVALIPFFYLARKLERGQDHDASEAGSQAVAPGRNRPRAGWIWTAAAALPVIAVPLALQAQDAAVRERGLAWEPALPGVNGEWQGPLRHADIWEPRFKNPDIQISGVYVSPDLEQVQLQLVAYRYQTQARELVYYQNQLYDKKQWQPVAVNTREVGDQPFGPDQVRETILRDKQNGAEIILWSWYELNNYQDISDVKIKLMGGFNKLIGDGRGALWALAGQCDSQAGTDCAAQRDVFSRFLGSLQASQ